MKTLKLASDLSLPADEAVTLGIVRTPARGMVVAAPFLFLEGA